jgi:O-antigen/teichoic acid export membrane protein
VAQAANTAALSIGLAWALGASATLLVLATVAGQSVALALLLLGLRSRRLVSGARPRHAWQLLRHYRRVVVFNVPHVLSDAAQAAGVPLVVAAFFGVQAAAYYAFATRLLKAPLGLVANAISQVFYPRAAAHRRDNDQLRHDAARLLRVLTAGVVLALPLVMLLPDALYAWAFGEGWRQAGDYLRALAPWAAASFIAAPLAVLYVVKERFALDFTLALAGTAVAFCTLLAAHFSGAGALQAMWALSLGMAVYVLLSALLEFGLVIGWTRRAG